MFSELHSCSSNFVIIKWKQVEQDESATLNSPRAVLHQSSDHNAESRLLVLSLDHHSKKLGRDLP